MFYIHNIIPAAHGAQDIGPALEDVPAKTQFHYDMHIKAIL